MWRHASGGGEQLAVGKDLVAVVDVEKVEGERTSIGGDADFGAEPGCSGESLPRPRFQWIEKRPGGVVVIRLGPRGIVSGMKAPGAVERD
jgi:hypothetical protein